MSEHVAVASLADVLRAAQGYKVSLRDFVTDHKLDDLIDYSLDHLAYKAANQTHYLACRDALTSGAAWVVEAQVQDRPISTFFYRKPIVFGIFGETKLVELMCPRPGKEDEFVGFEHTERVWTDLDSARRYLERHRIPFTPQDNGHHQTLVMVINRAGQELKLTSQGLLKVQEQEHQQGLLTDLKLPLNLKLRS